MIPDHPHSSEASRLGKPRITLLIRYLPPAVSDLSQTDTETARHSSLHPPPQLCWNVSPSISFQAVPKTFFFFPSWGFAKAHLKSSVPVPVQWPVNALCYRDMLPLNLNVESFLQKYPYLMKLEKHGQYRANKSICMWTLTGIKLAHLLPQLFAGRFLFCCRAAKFPLSTISVAAFYVSLHDTTQCKL